MYSVYQHWDPLKVCIVGKSYPPEFYSYIANSKIRAVMERIAMETEEDYQKLIDLLVSFGVKVLRPEIAEFHNYLIGGDTSFAAPPMTPRDYSIALGTDFYFHTNTYTDWHDLTWGKVLDEIRPHTNLKLVDDDVLTDFNSAMNTRVGRDLYIGTHPGSTGLENESRRAKLSQRLASNQMRTHVVNTLGHADGSFCPVVPGLIVSLRDIPTYTETFPGWEVIYLSGQSWSAVQPFLELKAKNKGKWWVPGEELNDEFTDFVEQWMGHWVGYVEETVFDVNMLVIDEKNVVCNNYNKEVFAAFEKRGITPHIVNFRHRYFWDGGLHCITSDVHREGIQKDYFPERG
jgi:hypothetical protein